MNNARPIAEIELSSLCECKSERKGERVIRLRKIKRPRGRYRLGDRERLRCKERLRKRGSGREGEVEVERETDVLPQLTVQ